MEGDHQDGSGSDYDREDDNAPFLILNPVSDDDDSLQVDVSRPSQKTLQRLRSNDPDFRRLELEDGYMTEWFYRDPQHIVEFLDAIRQNTTIQHVSVSGEFMSTMSEIMDAQPISNTIGEVDAENQGVDWQFFNAISRLPALTTLEIQEVMDFNGIALPVPVLKQLLQQATKLQNVTLRFVELVAASSSVEENDFDASISSLTNGVDQNQRNNNTLLESFRDHPSLQKVTFAQLRLGEGLALNTLIRGLASVPKLCKARIHMAVQRQQERRRNNHEDDTESNDIDRQASLKPICESKTLEVLELSSLRILDEPRMLKALHANKSLKNLFMGHMELSFSGWATLAHLLQRRLDGGATATDTNCGSLECLRLDHMTGLDDATVQVLCRALIPKANISFPTLQKLRLYNVFDMGRRGWVAIGEMLATNGSLSLLSLENCQGMDDDAVVGIANALKENTTLRHLELQVFAGHCTRFSQKVGQQALVDVLLSGKNITLKQIYTQAKGEHEAQLELYLKLNRSGVRQYVLEQRPLHACQEDDICMEFWKHLRSHMDDLDVLFYVLQTNPPFVMSCLRGL